jgi:hypothetical protein
MTDFDVTQDVITQTREAWRQMAHKSPDQSLLVMYPGHPMYKSEIPPVESMDIVDRVERGGYGLKIHCRSYNTVHADG